MTSPQPRQWVVSDQADGQRADQVVAAWMAEARARSQARLAAGEVSIDGEAIAKSRRVRAGETIIVAPAPAAAPVAAPPAVPIRYQDDDLAVVAKPSGMVVHAGAGVHDGTLVDALVAMGVVLADMGDRRRPGIVHRLDRGTSGLLVVASSDRAATALTAAFAAHTVRRTYWALVEGVPDPPSATIAAPLGRCTSNRTRFAVQPGGRHAITHYDLTEALDEAAILSVRLETGRTHQVRVHLSAVGHPVCGDRTYGAASDVTQRAELIRPALHAAELGFTHPVTGAEVACTEPLPDELVRAAALLRGGG